MGNLILRKHRQWSSKYHCDSVHFARNKAERWEEILVLFVSLISADEQRMAFLSNTKRSGQASTEISGPPCTAAPAPVFAAAQGLHWGKEDLPGFIYMLP